MSSKIIDERPILLLPSLALAIGLNNAIFLQQLNYWCNIASDFGYGVNHGGHTWVYKTADEWHEKDFPFWSVRTIRRIISDLGEKGIIVTAMLHDNKWNKTSYYRIDKENLYRILKSGSIAQSTDVDNLAQSRGQLGTIECDNLAQSNATTWHDVTENTTENTTEINTHTPDSIISESLKLWNPDMNTLNSRLQIAGLKPMEWKDALPIIVDINSHYERHIKNGTVTANKMYTNFVQWIKRDHSNDKKTFPGKQSNQPYQTAASKTQAEMDKWNNYLSSRANNCDAIDVTPGQHFLIEGE